MLLSAVFKRAKPKTSNTLEVLRVDGLSRKVSETFELKDISFTVAKGEGLALIGGNGAGKSTLIRLISGLSRPGQGEVTICGLATTRWRQVSKHLGYIQQHKDLPEDLTVKDYLSHQLRLRRADANRYDELMELAGLLPFENVPVDRLSGGNQRKLHILCAVGHRPDLLVLDEPTSGLDATMRTALLQFLQELKALGMSLIVATHHLDEVAALADHVVMLDQGCQLCTEKTSVLLAAKTGTCLEIKPHPGQEPQGSLHSWLEQQNLDYVTRLELHSDCVRLHCVDETRDYLPLLVALLSDAGIRISSIRSYEPTLDEIMRELTGPHLKKHDEEQL